MTLSFRMKSEKELKDAAPCVKSPIEGSGLDGVRAFLDAVAKLRDPKEGCPWDLAQDHKSLEKYFEEELSEFLQALRSYGPAAPETWEELGDVLLQVALHAQLASEKGVTDFNKICANAAEKLRLRHPHVFDPNFPKFKTADEVNRAWEEIKAYSRKGKSHTKAPPAFAEIPATFSSLRRSSRMGEKAASFGFDWPNPESVLEKISEEWRELEFELKARDDEKAYDELGDLFFALAQFARKKNWDPEQVLDKANQKFWRRFSLMDKLITSQSRRWEDFTLAELEDLWSEAKKTEK